MFDQMFLGFMDNNKQCIGTMVLVVIENFKLWAMDYKKKVGFMHGWLILFEKHMKFLFN